MVNKVVDHRTDYITKTCDAVIELDSSDDLSYEGRIVTGFQSESVDYILSVAARLEDFVNVFLYDLNSKPLK